MELKIVATPKEIADLVKEIQSHPEKVKPEMVLLIDGKTEEKTTRQITGFQNSAVENNPNVNVGYLQERHYVVKDSAGKSFDIIQDNFGPAYKCRVNVNRSVSRCSALVENGVITINIEL